MMKRKNLVQQFAERAKENRIKKNTREVNKVSEKKH